MRATKDFAIGVLVMTSPRNRYCAEPGCHTKLSVYNHGRYCVLHEAVEIVGPAAACDKCGQIKPLGDDYWHRDRYRASGWHSVCKECRNRANTTQHARRRLSRSGDGIVPCRQCGKSQPRDGDHWSFGAKSRLVQPCLACQDQNQRARAARHLEKYYQRHYGMSRAEYYASAQVPT